MEIITTADNRKIIVKVIAEYLGESSVYLGPPTFAYQVGCAIVDRDGIVKVDDAEKGEDIRQLLARNGLTKSEPGDSGCDEAKIQIPLAGMDGQGIRNFLNMLHSKQYLLNRSIGTEGFCVNENVIELLATTEFTTLVEVVTAVKGIRNFGKGFHFTDDMIIFTGFPFSEDSTERKAYTELAAAMVAQAKIQKRISPKETIEENEKYYMRSWLIRLGFGGQSGKAIRKELLKNLKGHTAFRTEAEKTKWQERQKEKREVKSEAGNITGGTEEAESGNE